MKFNVGDQVIYPNQGVGFIEEVLETSVGGNKSEFYRLRLSSNDSLVMVPVDNAESIGVRRLCSEKDLDKLFDILENGSVDLARDWKNRYKDNVEKMMTGSIFDVAQVLKNLHYLSLQKPLSFREKKMYDRARQLVISEISTVREKEDEQVDERMEKILVEACERLLKEEKEAEEAEEAEKAKAASA
ncbi:MAG TPA: CarD family transcriptional regulator [Acidobacteriota bacterium]|nr:CarD family transcriptional regulator [Acidobacteriota bacterium]